MEGKPRVFSRLTLVSAAEALASHSQAEFNLMVVRLELENDVPDDYSISVQKKCAALAKIVVCRSEERLETLEGEVSLGEAVVREAVTAARKSIRWPPQENFERALERDGFSVTWDSEERAALRPSLPVELGPEIDDEVHHVLEARGLATLRGHLDQALSAHVRGDWAASNGQLRAFMEGLLDDIAELLCPNVTASHTSENRRAILGKIGFLSEERREWSDDGKNYINGLFKMLHSEGSHKGLSDIEHSTFRLHLVLLTARLFLRRLNDWRA